MSLEIMQLDAEALYNQVVASMESELGEILNPGDERRIVAGNILAVVLAAVSQGNAYAKGQLVRYSTGEMLDLLGEFVGTERLPAAYARVNVRFSVSAPAGVTVTIPAGTRVTPDGTLYFATQAAASVAYDAGHVDLEAVATATGTDYNGYSAGAVNVIVDPVAYVTGAASVDVSSGGRGVEGDESYRAKIREAPAHFSVAGPAGAYRYWAMTADVGDVGIGDVSVASPAPTEVVVTVLMADGSQPSQAVLDAVEAILSADDVRPLTDLVTVQAPTEVSYTVTATYYVAQEDAANEQTIKAAAEAAYSGYLAWQSAKLGRAVNPDELRRRLLAAGVYRADLTAPAYAAIDADEVARAAAESALTYGGIL